jgi:hypothetical protein
MDMFIVEGADGGEDALLREQENDELKEELEQTREEIAEVKSANNEALPLSALKKKKQKRNLQPFEQWVEDVIAGRKTTDDEL